MKASKINVAKINASTITVGSMFPEPPYLIIADGPHNWTTVDVRPDVADWLSETFTRGVDFKWIANGYTLYALLPAKTLEVMMLRW